MMWPVNTFLHSCLFSLSLGLRHWQYAPLQSYEIYSPAYSLVYLGVVWVLFI